MASLTVFDRLNSFSGKTVMISGANGFKGKWLCLFLQQLGATVVGFGLTNKGQKGLDNFWFDIDQSQSIAYSEFDICDSQAVHSFVKDVKPDIVFHLAAMSLVADCEADPLNAFKVNVVGTANIYNAVGTYGVPKIVSATTDKVYLNDGSGSEAFKENSTLWGYEAYSASKVGAELVNDFWVKRGLNCGVLRAGNVVGGGDCSPNRLVPDAIAAIQRGSRLSLRMPNASRPWQHVLDCCVAYLLMGSREDYSETCHFNFGPYESKTVLDLTRLININGISAQIEVHPNPSIPDKDQLSLDPSNFLSIFGFKPRLDLSSIGLTTSSWYTKVACGENPLSITISQIQDYISKLSPEKPQ